MDNLDLLEPAHLYETKLKTDHHDLVVNTFDELTKKSGVDIEANKLTCRKISEKEQLLNGNKKNVSSLKMLLTLFVILIVIGSILLLTGVASIINSNLFGILFASIGVILLVMGIILINKVYKAKKKEIENLVNNLQEEIKKLKNEAYCQMRPLNNLFETSLPSRLFQKTCPLIEMDRILDIKKYQMLIDKFEMWDNSEVNNSILHLQSGSILGNPFIIFKDLNLSEEQHVYKGSLRISWRQSIGGRTQYRSEILHATYVAPAPVYSEETYLVYANEGAKKLSFSRKPSNINSMNEEQITKYVRKHEKDLDKFAEEQLKKGKLFSPIGNPEFELFFGGLDRDDEVEFRLLFSALGQKSMMDLLKSKSGYGDDFSFQKIKGINLIQSAHTQGSNLFFKKEDFQGYDYEVIKNNFISFNDNYFKAVFFDFAPLLSIPLYQQYKTTDYIYKGQYKSNYAPFEHEVLANKFNPSTFCDPKTKTKTILKTNILEKNGNTDKVIVTAHSYDAVNRVAYVPVRGGDGRIHEVPVEWIEYIKLENSSNIEVVDLGNDDENKFNSLGNNSIIYDKGLLSSKDAFLVSIDELKLRMQNK